MTTGQELVQSNDVIVSRRSIFQDTMTIFLLTDLSCGNHPSAELETNPSDTDDAAPGTNTPYRLCIVQPSIHPKRRTLSSLEAIPLRPHPSSFPSCRSRGLSPESYCPIFPRNSSGRSMPTLLAVNLTRSSSSIDMPGLYLSSSVAYILCART